MRAAGSPHIPRTTSVSQSAVVGSMMTTEDPGGIAVHMPCTTPLSPPHFAVNYKPNAGTPAGRTHNTPPPRPPLNLVVNPSPKAVTAAPSTKTPAQHPASAPHAARQ